MPLTQEEQRAFEEITRRLGDPERRRAARLLAAAAAGFVAGFAVLVATFVVSVWAALLGYLVMLNGALLAERALRVLVGPRWVSAQRFQQLSNLRRRATPPAPPAPPA